MENREPAPLSHAQDRLEQAVRRLLADYRALAEENVLLYEQLRLLRGERASVKERTEQARHHVEGMINRLRAMEYPE